MVITWKYKDYDGPARTVWFKDWQDFCLYINRWEDKGFQALEWVKVEGQRVYP
jgi:hypothetical protein